MFKGAVKLLTTTVLVSLIVSSVDSLQRPNDVLLRTDKKVYKIGEKVTIILENNSNKTVYLRNSAPWRVEKRVGSEWTVVFTPIALQVITPLSPGGSKKWVWSQRDGKGRQVSEGEYRAILTVDNKILEAYFEIKKNDQGGDLAMYFTVIAVIVLIIVLVYVILRYRASLLSLKTKLKIFL